MLGSSRAEEKLREPRLEIPHLHLHLWQLSIKVFVHIGFEVQVPGVDAARGNDVLLLLQLLVHHVQLGQLVGQIEPSKEDCDLLTLAWEQTRVVLVPLGEVGLGGQEPDRVELLS